MPYGSEVNKENPSQGNVCEQGMDEPVDYEFDHDVMYHIDDDAIISGKDGYLETWMDDDSLVLSNANGKMIVGMRGIRVGACAGGMEAGSLGVKPDYTTHKRQRIENQKLKAMVTCVGSTPEAIP